MLPILKNIPKDKELKNRSRPQRCRAVRSADIEKMVIVSIFVSGNDSNAVSYTHLTLPTTERV